VYTQVTGVEDGTAALEWLLTLLAFPERLPAAETVRPEARDLYRALAATLNFDDPLARQSPLASLFPPGGALNPFQALSSAALPAAERDRLALLVFWRERSRAGAWDEASQALALFAGQRAALEVWYNAVPWAALVSALALVGLGLAWVLRRRNGRWSAVVPGLTWLTVTAWLAVRMAISGRPPVTNLASTFLLVSWFSLGVATAAAFLQRPRAIVLGCLAAGAVLAVLATALQGSADPFAPLQAVLNTNFWLSIHVTAIVAGYAATLAASLIGHVYLAVAGGSRGTDALVPLWRNLKAALGVGLALTLTGTVLGGLWADQSWGRFWGWDPKENGALLIVLWLALSLHLKPSGWAAEWGTAVAAALALPVLWFSWLGVNLLGQGFHSYGFAPGKAFLFLGVLAAEALVLFVLVLRKVLR
jgi:ABC-type transport system involved in cytochrome c biogenesis permease subunit